MTMDSHILDENGVRKLNIVIPSSLFNPLAFEFEFFGFLLITSYQ